MSDFANAINSSDALVKRNFIKQYKKALGIMSEDIENHLKAHEC